MSNIRNDSKTKYLKVRIRIFFIAIILFASLNWGFTAFGFNLVESLHLFLNEILGVETYVDKIIYIIFAIAAIIIGSKKGTWISFLGETVFPSIALIPSKVKTEYDLKITVPATPLTRVAYWGSLPKTDSSTIPNVVAAYGNFSNSGVVTSDEKGNAVLLLDESTPYKIPSGETIQRHVHYRELDQEYGFLGEIKTFFY